MAVSALQAYLLGQGWDEALRQIDEQLERDPDPADRIHLTETGLLFRAERRESSAEQIDQLTKGLDRMSDPQISSGNHFLRSVDAMARGDFGTSFHEAIRAFEIESRGMGEVLGHHAGMAALWLRDVDRARFALTHVDHLPRGGKVVRAFRIGLRGVVDALEGKPDAAAGLQEAIRRLKELGMAFHAAQLGVAFAMAVGVAHPDARAAAEEASAVFARLEAKPWLERTDAVLSGQISPILAPEPVPEEAPIP